MFLAHCVGEPPVLVEAMVNCAEEYGYENVEIKHMVSLGAALMPNRAWKSISVRILFSLSANIRRAVEEGRADFTRPSSMKCPN